jgi:hypothetical protein
MSGSEAGHGPHDLGLPGHVSSSRHGPRLGATELISGSWALVPAEFGIEREPGLAGFDD